MTPRISRGFRAFQCSLGDGECNGSLRGFREIYVEFQGVWIFESWFTLQSDFNTLDIRLSYSRTLLLTNSSTSLFEILIFHSLVPSCYLTHQFFILINSCLIESDLFAQQISLFFWILWLIIDLFSIYFIGFFKASSKLKIFFLY